MLEAFAPVVGAASTFLLTLQGPLLGLGLAGSSGFFLYIGASDLVPESCHEHPRTLTALMTVLGISVMFVAIRLAGG